MSTDQICAQRMSFMYFHQKFYNYVFIYYLLNSKYLNIVVVTVAMTSAAYNGASFYIDVFSLKYNTQKKSS